MFKNDRPKDPKKVAAGQAAHHKLTAGMSEAEYRAFQRQCRERALAAHPGMQAAGAANANQAQVREWGNNDYIAQRKTAYQCCVEKHGERVAKAAVRRATLRRRRDRLHAPTRGEAALRALLHELGFTVHLDAEPFDYLTWRLEPLDRSLGPRDALAEGGVGPYFCDVLLPVLRLAIGVEGGVHVLNRERDARRLAYLHAQGLTVIVVPDTAAQPLELTPLAAQLTAQLANHLGDSRDRRSA